MNFSGAAQKDYRVPLKNAKSISVLLDTDWQRFNGATPQGKTDITYNEKTQEIACTLPAFGSILISIK